MKLVKQTQRQWPKVVLGAVNISEKKLQENEFFNFWESCH